jgi:hypothetical protein
VCRIAGMKRKAKMYEYMAAKDIKSVVKSYIGEIDVLKECQ